MSTSQLGWTILALGLVLGGIGLVSCWLELVNVVAKWLKRLGV
jgi:hypothetical protein